MLPRESFPWTPSLRMPLRDVLRGMAEVSSVGERAARNLPSILPPFLEEQLRSVAHQLGATTSRIFSGDLTPDALSRAARFAAGASSDKADADCFVRVASFGWEHLRSRFQNTRELFSETIASARLSMQPPGSFAEAENSAQLLECLRQSSAIGSPPGLPPHRSAAEQAEVDVNLFAILLWLFATRSDDPSQEPKLLDLASVLTTAHRFEVVGAMSDRRRLAGHIAGLAGQL